MRRQKTLFWLVAICCMLFTLTRLAQAMESSGFLLDWSVIPNGAGSLQSASFKMDATIGQPSIGTAQSTTYRAGFGFWGQTSMDYPVYLPLVVQNLGH